MIGKLTGRLSGTKDGHVLVEVGGVGYVVRVPLSTTLPRGKEVSLFVHTAVREDAIDLYGFLLEEELSFFRQLMTVSSVGPKTALSIMSVGDAQALKRTISSGDASALHKVFGIGKKSAERIVVELKDKVLGTASPLAAGALGDDAEVVEALMALGYSAHESRAALKSAKGESTKERLGSALKNLGSRSAV